MYSSEYAQPLPRKTTLQIPMVADHVTGRLRAQEIYAGSGQNDYTTQVLVENTGLTQFIVQLQETNLRGISGARTTIGPAVTLVPGGRNTYTILPTKRYLEVTSTRGDGKLRMQLESQVRWDELGFAKDDPFYPVELWEPAGINLPLA